MKTWKSILFTVLLFSSMVIIPSCSTYEDPTTGILTITVMTTTGEVVVGEEVFLATSYQNLQAGIYVARGWTDIDGQIWFADLLPMVYWYDTVDWEDYGASQVYAGIEHYVILWVNTPQPKNQKV